MSERRTGNATGALAVHNATATAPLISLGGGWSTLNSNDGGWRIPLRFAVDFAFRHCQRLTVNGKLGFLAEALNVFGAFLQLDGGAALHEFANLLDDIGIGKGGDVASVHVVFDGGQHATHDFA